jgi:hypothetical protein
MKFKKQTVADLIEMLENGCAQVCAVASITL